MRDLHEPVDDFSPPLQDQIDRVVCATRKALSRAKPVAISCLAGYAPLSKPQAERLVQFVKRRQGLMVPSSEGIRRKELQLQLRRHPMLTAWDPLLSATALLATMWSDDLALAIASA